MKRGRKEERDEERKREKKNERNRDVSHNKNVGILIVPINAVFICAKTTVFI